MFICKGERKEYLTNTKEIYERPKNVTAEYLCIESNSINTIGYNENIFVRYPGNRKVEEYVG